MTTTAYQPTLTGAVAREHVNDLLRDAAASRAAAQLPGRNRAPHAAAPRLCGGSASPPGRQPAHRVAPNHHRHRQAREGATDMKQQKIVQRTTRCNPQPWTCAPRPGAPFPSDPAQRRIVDIRREHLCECPAWPPTPDRTPPGPGWAMVDMRTGRSTRVRADPSARRPSPPEPDR